MKILFNGLRVRSVMFHLLEHIILACLMWLISWVVLKDVIAGAAIGILNISLDFDHLFEYLAWSKGKFYLKEFLFGDYFVKKEKIIIFLHCWEYVILGIIIWLLTKNIIWFLASFSISVHLLFDTFCYKNNASFYLLTYRISKKFDKGLLNEEHD